MIDTLKYESPRCGRQWSLMDEIQVSKKTQWGLEASFYGEFGLEY